MTFTPMTPGAWKQFELLAARLRQECRDGKPGSDFEYRLISRAAYPSDFASMIERLRAGDREAIEPVISWLEGDPFCMHSGYAKERLMRYLAGCRLSTRNAARLCSILLKVTQQGGRPEFRTACRLARKVQTPEFCRELRTLQEAAEGAIAQRASWMLSACERHAPHESS